jgi:hypothetical protein
LHTNCDGTRSEEEIQKTAFRECAGACHDSDQRSTEFHRYAYEAKLSAFFLSNENAVGVLSQSTPASGKPDTHVYPDTLLRWAHQFDLVRLSASGDIAFDRYLKTTV